MEPQSWSKPERVQVFAAGLAPLAIALAIAALASLEVGSQALFLLPILAPAAYATLLFFVLPALWVLRRTGKASTTLYVATTGLSALVPWLLLYTFLFPAGSGKYGGAPLYVLCLLATPTVLATAAGALVCRLGGSSPSEATPNPSVKGTCLRQAPYVER